MLPVFFDTSCTVLIPQKPGSLAASPSILCDMTSYPLSFSICKEEDTIAKYGVGVSAISDIIALSLLISVYFLLIF